MTRKLTLSTLVLVGCLALAGLTFAQTCADIHGEFGCALSPLDGTPVTLTGVVYAVPGVYNPGSVYFICGDGGGMTFYNPAAVVAEGDVITVEGVVGAFGEEIQLTDTSFTIGTSGNSYLAQTILTGDLAAGTPNLGGFMQVSGLLTKVSDYTYTVDDDSGPVLVYVDPDTGIDKTRIDQWEGDIVSVAGATMCWQGAGEILPRRDSDIQLLLVADEAQSWGSIKSTYR